MPNLKEIAAAHRVLATPNQSTVAQMAALSVLRAAESITPTLSQVFTALAGIAAAAASLNDYDNEFTVVYKFVNQPGGFNVRAASAAKAVAHLSDNSPIFMVLHALHHADPNNGGGPADTQQLITAWYDSDN